MKDLRYEIKMVCDQHELERVRSWVRIHPAHFISPFPPRQINNVYFDTPNLNSFAANLAGISTRQKLRARWYGDDLATAVNPILELKYKESMLGGKERFPIKASLDLTQPWRKILQVIRANVDIPETRTELRQRLIAASQATVINRYFREYYVTADQLVRLTLDYNQQTFQQRFSPRPNLTQHGPDLFNMVIELKADAEHIEELYQVASRFPLRRNRNSKYVNGVLLGNY